MAIESDEKGADSRLAVQFYTRPVQNEFETQRQGRPIFLDCDFVKIFVPGDSLSVIDQPVREDHKTRFPIQWAHYQNKHGGDSKEIGTPLSQWALLTPSQVEELRALKFYTVENVANAADIALQRINMIAGMSPYAFRDRAVRFLKSATEESLANADNERIKALEAENASMKEKLDSILANMQTTEHSKPGRKKRTRIEPEAQTTNDLAESI